MSSVPCTVPPSAPLRGKAISPPGRPDGEEPTGKRRGTGEEPPGRGPGAGRRMPGQCPQCLVPRPFGHLAFRHDVAAFAHQALADRQVIVPRGQELTASTVSVAA
ncbi:hypothetical protein GCM10015536_24990 [Streptomyces griseomycini]|nr:hypothetical protein GCM10015536_24990 [Streptomyces griseomycini]